MKNRLFKTIKATIPLDYYRKLVILRKTQHLTNSHIVLNGLISYFQHLEEFNNIKIEDLQKESDKK